jgi:hypothetical protein
VYVQVIDANANVDPCCPEQVVVHICDPHGEDDAEWLVLDETSSNSYVFFTNAGTELEGVWDPLGIGLADGRGGYQLQVDNWKIEAFNEDDIYARYNDVYYETDETGMTGLGDQDMGTAFPPVIDRVRVFNDVSFDLMSIKDTQVYNGSTVTMKFLDRNGNEVSGEYLNSDCVFLQVTDDDQDEDLYRRERIDGYWDGGQNVPFGPQALNPFHCDLEYPYGHGVNSARRHEHLQRLAGGERCWLGNRKGRPDLADVRRLSRWLGEGVHPEPAQRTVGGGGPARDGRSDRRVCVGHLHRSRERVHRLRADARRSGRRHDRRLLPGPDEPLRLGDDFVEGRSGRRQLDDHGVAGCVHQRRWHDGVAVHGRRHGVREGHGLVARRSHVAPGRD